MAAIMNLPSRLLLQPMRLSMAARQRELTDTQVEASTGRHANMQVTLGTRMGTDISLRLQLAITSLDRESAEQAKVRAGALQDSLSMLSDIAGHFRSTLMGARGNASGRDIAVTNATSSLAAMQDSLNIAFDGLYLFGGQNTGIRPVKDYDNGPRQAILSAFNAEFGFLPDDTAAANLTPAQVSNFLNGSFQQLFENSSWSSTWSNATDETPIVRLGGGEEVNAAATANEPFARTMAAAFSMMDVLGRGRINLAALETVIDSSLSLVSEAQLALGDTQSRLGVGENRLAIATQGLKARETHFSSSIAALEATDSYEAATRVNVLMSQLEASYALTARISKMSLLSYI